MRSTIPCHPALPSNAARRQPSPQPSLPAAPTRQTHASLLSPAPSSRTSKATGKSFNSSSTVTFPPSNVLFVSRSLHLPSARATIVPLPPPPTSLITPPPPPPTA